MSRVVFALRVLREFICISLYFIALLNSLQFQTLLLNVKNNFLCKLNKEYIINLFNLKCKKLCWLLWVGVIFFFLYYILMGLPSIVLKNYYYYLINANNKYLKKTLCHLHAVLLFARHFFILRVL